MRVARNVWGSPRRDRAAADHRRRHRHALRTSRAAGDGAGLVADQRPRREAELGAAGTTQIVAVTVFAQRVGDALGRERCDAAVDAPVSARRATHRRGRRRAADRTPDRRCCHHARRRPPTPPPPNPPPMPPTEPGAADAGRAAGPDAGDRSGAARVRIAERSLPAARQPGGDRDTDGDARDLVGGPLHAHPGKQMTFRRVARGNPGRAFANRDIRVRARHLGRDHIPRPTES